MKKKIIIPLIIVAIVVIAVIFGIVIVKSATSNESSNGLAQSKDSNSTNSKEKYYKIGDTVSTDIAEFTLNDSALTITLLSTNSSDYSAKGEFREDNYTPKEFDRQEDLSNPYTADTGHTLAWFDFTMSAVDRSDIDIDLYSDTLVKVKYNNKDYSYKKKIGQSSTIDFTIGREKKITSNGTIVNGKMQLLTGAWRDFSSISAIHLLAGEKSQFRGYMQIPENITNLQDKFYITFMIPNSKGKTTPFTYAINE